MNVFETLTESYDDPYADLQASLAVLEIEDAHRIATGKGVTVAVIDSSVDDRHPDFRRRVSANRDLVADEARAPHGEVHGTAIAGIIVSEVNNQEGIVGIAPDASLVALRACWAPVPGASSATCSTFSLALALETAIRLHAQVINLSLTGPSDPLLAELIDAALGRGVIVVAAAPDAASDDTGFPASHAGVIAAHTATVADSSSRAGLPAPGREILTTTPNAGYGFLSGNSLATAHVSGVVALLLERNPELRAQRLVELLAESRHRSGQDAINACWALAEVTASASCPPPADLAQR